MFITYTHILVVIGARWPYPRRRWWVLWWCRHAVWWLLLLVLQLHHLQHAIEVLGVHGSNRVQCPLLLLGHDRCHLLQCRALLAPNHLQGVVQDLTHVLHELRLLLLGRPILSRQIAQVDPCALLALVLYSMWLARSVVGGFFWSRCFLSPVQYMYIYGALGCPMILPSMLCLACFMNELFVELMNEAG